MPILSCEIYLKETRISVVTPLERLLMELLEVILYIMSIDLFHT